MNDIEFKALTYRRINRIDDMASRLKGLYARNMSLTNKDLLMWQWCGMEAELVLEYLQMNRSEQQMMIDCCKIEIYYISHFIGNEKIGTICFEVWNAFEKIHYLAMMEIWHISKDDIDKSKYYISKDGECKNKDGDIIPIPQNNTNDFVKVNNSTDATTNSLPCELDTPDAKAIFDEARDMGLLDCDYKWLKTKQLLACFAQKMSDKLMLGKGVNSDGTNRISWQPFECLFNKKNLRLSYNDIQKTGQLPREHELIDKLFEKL
jgi:hypothetical protein